MIRITITPCNACGKDLLWGFAPWPIETEPRPYGSQILRAYVFARSGPKRARAIDVRDLADPPDMVYPQHQCREWQRRQDQAEHAGRRAEQIMDRLFR